jgi:hypothetical protein
LNVFVKSKQLSETQAPVLPCHDLDHNLYNEELYLKIQGRVWDQIGKVQEDGRCFNKDHAVAQFKALSESFRETLKLRGQRSPGIQTVLAKMKPRRAHAESDLGPHWWVPFSMAKTSDAQQFPIYDLYPAEEPDPATIKRRKKLKAQLPRGP